MTGLPSALLAAALSYSGRGWPVLPLHTVLDARCSCADTTCAHPGKHPRIRSGKQHAHAAVDASIIAEWWKRWPTSNVGVVTGARSGLVVLDIDPRHGGLESLHDIEEQHGPLPVMPTVITGSGGLHLYFRHPGGRVPNRVSIFPGIDLRGDGGLVVCPPSVHVQGSYRWRS